MFLFKSNNSAPKKINNKKDIWYICRDIDGHLFLHFTKPITYKLSYKHYKGIIQDSIQIDGSYLDTLYKDLKFEDGFIEIKVKF